MSTSIPTKRGRWTPEEREMFEKLLGIHGKEWKKIADILKTRTVVQVRTHAQKYFKKLAKTTGTSVLSTSKKQGLHLPGGRSSSGSGSSLNADAGGGVGYTGTESVATEQDAEHPRHGRYASPLVGIGTTTAVVGRPGPERRRGRGHRRLPGGLDRGYRRVVEPMMPEQIRRSSDAWEWFVRTSSKGHSTSSIPCISTAVNPWNSGKSCSSHWSGSPPAG